MSEQQHAEFEIDLDQTETQAWGGEQRPLVPQGDYHLMIVGFDSETGPKGPYIAVTFEVQDEGDQKGAKVWNNYSLTEKARGRLKSLQVAVGATLTKIISTEFVGATIVGTVVHTQGQATIDENGQPREARTFANVINERAVEATQPAATPTKQPPVQKAPPVAQNAKPANNATRRA